MPGKSKKKADETGEVMLDFKPWACSLFQNEEETPYWTVSGRGVVYLDLDMALHRMRRALQEGHRLRVVWKVPPAEVKAFVEELKVRGLETGWTMNLDGEAGQIELVSGDPEEALKPLKLIRSAVHLERHKLGKDRKELQRFLPGLEKEIGEVQEESLLLGLNLSLAEDRALHALQILLADTGYQGHSQELEPTKAWGEQKITSLTFKPHEFLEAYGLKVEERHGQAFKDAMQGLKKLSESLRIILYQQKYREDGKEKIRIVRTKKPLVNLVEEYRDLTEEEAEKVRDGKEVARKRALLHVRLSPLIMDGLDNYYLLKAKDFHKEIVEAMGGKRYSAAVVDFINFLLTLDLPEIRASRDFLAKKMRLAKYVEQRKWGLIDKRISEALEVAVKLQYLLRYEPTGAATFRLYLNPERCYRPFTEQAKKKRARQEKTEEVPL